jgi:hypothetical protein
MGRQGSMAIDFRFFLIYVPRSWVDRVVWLLTFVFFLYMFLMCVGCATTKYGAPQCMYGWCL